MMRVLLCAVAVWTLKLQNTCRGICQLYKGVICPGKGYVENKEDAAPWVSPPSPFLSKCPDIRRIA